MGRIGLIGLGVMGENLAVNIASKGYGIVVYNRTASKTREFLERAGGVKEIAGAYTLNELTSSLERPRKIILMVKAGQAVDDIITELEPHLSPGDILFDCGNSHYLDTERRQRRCAGSGIVFMGVGVSGGEEGALKGPSIMVGGDREAYDATADFWRSIAAKADGRPCAGYMGVRGAGHFVKMVHNGIEYALLQLIAETYDVMSHILGLGAVEISDVFREWGRSELSSYLLEIAADALKVVDEETGRPLVDMVLDKAEQKGTGKWAVQTAAELGVPTPSIDAALSARYISALKDTRAEFAKTYGRSPRPEVGREKVVDMLRDAYWCAKVVCYAQGLDLIDTASRQYGYGTDIGEVLAVWRAGCIIRSSLLKTFQSAVERLGQGRNILLDGEIAEMMKARMARMESLLSILKTAGIPTPVYDASINYLLSMKRDRLPANIIQALRDRFGAHTFERVDKPGRFHHSWRP
ncbi:6-phosphogluconate dehydrogenase, NADP(+)-dependent, decarboxylating [archaeon HR01]|nr:6-phosphogluconate dehydrogenase, NADP(+)-dependent, decarboxylating [archaeon HR01]